VNSRKLAGVNNDLIQSGKGTRRRRAIKLLRYVRTEPDTDTEVNGIVKLALPAYRPPQRNYRDMMLWSETNTLPTNAANSWPML